MKKRLYDLLEEFENIINQEKEVIKEFNQKLELIKEVKEVVYENKESIKRLEEKINKKKIIW